MKTQTGKRAWIWVAIATFTVASITCAQNGVRGAKAYAGPVFELLGAHANASAADAASAPRLSPRRTALSSDHASSSDGLLAAMLPVLFVGLLSPLALLSPRSVLCLGRPTAAPPLPFRFQRPPPALLS